MHHCNDVDPIIENDVKDDVTELPDASGPHFPPRDTIEFGHSSDSLERTKDRSDESLAKSRAHRLESAKCVPNIFERERPKVYG